MLVYVCILLYITCAITDAEEHTATLKLHDTHKKDLRIQNVASKTRSKSNKLTFQTLYPQFLSTWSSLKSNKKQRQVPVTKKKEERRQYSVTKKVNMLKIPTTIKTKSNHNAFIEVETMRPYVPKRNTTSRKTSKRKISRFGQNKPSRNLSAPVSTSHKFPNFLKDHIKRKRILTAVPTSYPLKKLNSLVPKTSQIRNHTNIPLTNEKQALSRLQQLESDLNKIRGVVKNGTKVINNLKSEVQTSSVGNAKIEIENVNRIKARMNSDGNIDIAKKNYRNQNQQNKVNQHRMEWLRQKLAGEPNQAGNYGRNNNFDDVNNKDEGKEDNYSIDKFEETNAKLTNFMRSKIQTGIDKKHFSKNNTHIDIRHFDQITKDPLAYDSFDLQLEHESNIQEIARLKNVNAKPTSKPHVDKKSTKMSTTVKQDVESNFPSLYNNHNRRASFLYAPPPGFNETNLKSIKDKRNDQEVFNDVLEKILNGPPNALKNDYVIDKTEALGRKMLERLDLPGLKSSFDETISNKDFDHVKYVDSVMKQSALPLSERRNIVKKSVDQRLNELYEKFNLKPIQTTKDDLDDVLKSMGATLHK